MSKASSTALSPNGINARIIASAAGVAIVPSSNGIACWTGGAICCWFFVAFRRTLRLGGVLGNEWRSLAEFTLSYRGST